MRARTALARLVLVGLVAAAPVACSDDGDGGGGAGGSAPPTSLTGLLGLVPDTAAVRGAEIYYTSFERVRTGLPAAASAIDDLINLNNASSFQASVPIRYGRCISSDQCLPELGWDTRSVEAWIEFGEVSERTEALVGSFSPADIESAIRNGPAGSSVQTTSIDGATVFSIGTEGETEITERSGYSQIGRGVTVAVNDSLLVSADFRADAEGVLTGSASPSLAQDPNYAAVAAALDTASVDQAVITPAFRDASWQLAGFGEAVTADDDSGTPDPAVVTYVFVFADNAAAQAGEAEFRSIVETGTSDARGVAWSERLTITSSSVDGNVVVVTMQADSAGWWIDPLRLADNLVVF
ncbi:MAG TPA: hypothetical protein DCR14_16430 [Acidimicrobiaceae bacterium]|nr:hypothetical protein [Acidimicrobiaceae bacterium]